MLQMKHTQKKRGRAVRVPFFRFHLMMWLMIHLLRSFLQIKDGRLMTRTAAIGAANHRVGHGAETLTAPALDLNLLFKAEELFDHLTVQLQGFGLVRPQNIRHRTGVAQLGSPGQRIRIPFDQTADLYITSPMKVSVIEFALFSSRRFHRSLSIRQLFLKLIRKR